MGFLDILWNVSILTISISIVGLGITGAMYVIVYIHDYIMEYWKKRCKSKIKVFIGTCCTTMVLSIIVGSLIVYILQLCGVITL